MVRNYKRTSGSRDYKNYSERTLQKALRDITNDRLSIGKAALKYNIPRNTLKNKSLGIHVKTPGGQPALNLDEESIIEKHLILLSDYGLALDSFDLRVIVRSYLNNANKVVPKFSANLPGLEWTRSYIKRRGLTQRIAGNISLQRAAVSPDIINKFFDHYEQEVTIEINGEKIQIPASNIWDYDETNLSDDPGKKKIICKRGIRYPERVMNSSKSSTSIMICGSAAGEVLPPYVVYKSLNVYKTWTERGPKKARYTCSKSGWFDTSIFEDWFFTTALPRFKKLEGPVILLGDNLSSHVNLKVLEACEKHNIKLIFLPPNSTHIMQPLDVAYFHPMKVVWRKILRQFKEQSKVKYIKKEYFPSLLAKLLEILQTNGPQNLVSGFRKCGLYPVNRFAVIDRLPDYRANTDSLSLISEVFKTKKSSRKQWRREWQ